MKSRRFVWLAVVLVAAVLVAAVPLLASAASLQDVKSQIQEKAGIENLQITTDNGKVVLLGRTDTLGKKMEAEEIAEHKLKSDVINNITVTRSERSDQEINVDVAAKIRSRAAVYPVFNELAVRTEGGNIILTGRVRDAYLAKEAEEAAASVPGVRTVTNRIQVLPTSTEDDRLRVAIYRRLRNDDRLFQYFLGATPSINIIIDHSKVTLTGFVNSDVDRVLSASVARQTFGVLSVDNQLKVE